MCAIPIEIQRSPESGLSDVPEDTKRAGDASHHSYSCAVSRLASLIQFQIYPTKLKSKLNLFLQYPLGASRNPPRNTSALSGLRDVALTELIKRSNFEFYSF